MGEEFFFTSFIRNNSLNNIGELLNKRNGHPYLMVGNNPIQKIDYLGLLHIPSRCPKNTCDQWKLTIDTVGSVGAGKAAGLVIGAQLDADRGCCMDNYASSYKFAGGGIGIGLNISISVGGGARWISTECITWDDHVGFGRATTLGIGIIKTVGTLYVTTPQAYLNYSGVGTGFDLSAVTSVGRWFLNDDIQGR